MKKVKLLVSIGIAMTLSVAIIHEISKIEETNKIEIAKTMNEERALDNKKEEAIKEEVDKIEEKSKVDNIENTKTSISVARGEDELNTETQKSVEVEESKVEESEPALNNENSNYNNNAQAQEQFEELSYNESNSYISEIEQAIFTSVNAERSANGLVPLSYNNTMQDYARIKSKDMGDRGYFDHTSPDGELITAQMKRDGVTYNAWGENIAYIQGNSNNASLGNQFMTNWMNSQGHRENILSTNFTSIGIGVYKIGNTYYATQEFDR